MYLWQCNHESAVPLDCFGSVGSLSLFTSHNPEYLQGTN